MDSRPDRAFRIADRRHDMFDGTGAFLNGARWNSPGRRVIYAADTFGGAMLEILAHTRIGTIPRTHAWIEISIPSKVSWESLHAKDLPGWNAEDCLASREFGDRWVDQKRSTVLLVPSVATSGVGRNVLFNQDHPHFRYVRASQPREVVWDARLFERVL